MLPFALGIANIYYTHFFRFAGCFEWWSQQPAGPNDYFTKYQTRLKMLQDDQDDVEEEEDENAKRFVIEKQVQSVFFSSFALLPLFGNLDSKKWQVSLFFTHHVLLRVTAVNTRYLVSANRRSCQGTASGESVVIRKENSAEWRFLTTCCPVSIVALIRATLRNAQQCSCCFLPVRMRYVLP